MVRSRAVTCKGGFEPSVNDAISAVESLYADRIRPSGRLILKRVGEHAALTCGSVPHIDHKRLRKLCYSSAMLQVEQDGGDYVVFIHERPADFVEVSSTFDPFPASFWSDFAAYLGSLSAEAARLPGGRYACAQLLTEKKLPLLKNCSLGEICHIIELAISRHKLLGYFDGCVVPYSCSEAGQKECCAAWMQPSCSSKRALPQFPVVGWEQARTCLVEILDVSGGAVPLPNVKRLFHSRFQLELSETFLGHAKVADLLTDSRLSDICTVTRQTNGSYLVERKQPQISCAHYQVPLNDLIPCTMWQTGGTTEETLLSTAFQHDPRTLNSCPPQFQELPVHSSCIDHSIQEEPEVFFALSTPTPWCDITSVGCAQSYQSRFAGLLQSEGLSVESPSPPIATPSPWDVQPCTSRFSELLRFETSPVASVARHESCSSTAAPSAQFCLREISQNAALDFSEDCDFDSMVQNTFLHIAPLDATRTGSSRRTRSLPQGFRCASSAGATWDSSATCGVLPKDQLDAKELEIVQLRARLASAEAENDSLKRRASRSSSASTASGEAVSLSWADEPVEDDEVAFESQQFQMADSVNCSTESEEVDVGQRNPTCEYDGWTRSRQSYSRNRRSNDKGGERHRRSYTTRGTGGQHRLCHEAKWRW